MSTYDHHEPILQTSIPETQETFVDENPWETDPGLAAIEARVEEAKQEAEAKVRAAQEVARARVEAVYREEMGSGPAADTTGHRDSSPVDLPRPQGDQGYTDFFGGSSKQ